MKYEEISPVMRMFLGNREGLRRFGFSADDLFLMTARSASLGNRSSDRHPIGGRLACFCVLRTQGKEFSILCGPIESEEDVANEYKRVCEAQDKISPSDCDRIWEESEVCAKKIELLIVLTEKGFRIPGNTN